jgi:hypothetical protein
MFDNVPTLYGRRHKFAENDITTWYATQWKSAMAMTANPLSNRILAGLSPSDQQEIFPQLELTSLTVGAKARAALDVQRNLYFPAGCVVSLLYPLRDRKPVEVAVVANDGVIGLGLLLGTSIVPPVPIVHRPGPAFRLAEDRLHAETSASLALRLQVLQYSHDLLSQMVQTSHCQRNHSLAQQLCRWLLNALDCRDSVELAATHALIGNLLGVHPDAIGRATRRLESAGVIATRRGYIALLDRPRLERLSCECYAVVKRDTERHRRMAQAA